MRIVRFSWSLSWSWNTMVLLILFVYRFHLITAIRRMFAPSTTFACNDSFRLRKVPWARWLTIIGKSHAARTDEEESRRVDDFDISFNSLLIAVLAGIKVPLCSPLFDKELTRATWKRSRAFSSRNFATENWKRFCRLENLSKRFLRDPIFKKI